MLAALKSCIKGYKSLYMCAGIIQYNVSIGNLIMNGEDDNPSWLAFLINFNLAIKEQ